MKIEQKSKLPGRGVLVCAGIALAVGLAASNAQAQQYRSTYGSGGGSVVIDPKVLNSMGGPAVTTQGTAIIPIPGTGASLLAPPLSTPRSRLLAAGGSAPAQTGVAPAPTGEPASRLLVAPASSAPTAAAPQIRQPAPQTAPQPAPRVASVSDETPPPPSTTPPGTTPPGTTAMKEPEPTAPTPMQAAAPTPPARAVAVKDEDKATTAQAPEAAPEPAPSPGAAPDQPAMAEPKPVVEDKPMVEEKPMAEEKPVAEPELPKTPSTTAAPTAPQPAPEPAAPSATQTASLPPAGEEVDERLVFDAEQDELDDAMRAQLETVSAALLGDEARRIELRGYADAAGGNAGSARRVSLKRAVSVRRFLMDQGVRSTRIDVRALGDKDDTGGPADRVDLILSQ